MLVAARPPLVAFNVELAPPATVDDARAIAALIREGGAEGLEGVRAIGLWLDARGVAQVSTNVEDHRATPLARVVAAIARHATPLGAELVGLAPAGRVRRVSRRRCRCANHDDRGCARSVRELTASPLSCPCTMAQTKRKRRTKHRGTAAGTIQARGRTGRPPTADESKSRAGRTPESGG